MNKIFNKTNNIYLKVCIIFGFGIPSTSVLASIAKPTLPDGTPATNNTFADLKKIFKGSGEIGIYASYILMWLIAAYLIIGGANEGRGGKGWGNFWVGLFIAAVLVVVGGIFLSSAETALENL